MKLAIMQPYFFPYIGYWQLINAVDRFILFDDVQYIRHGWINRNRVLKNGGGWKYVTIPVKRQGREMKIKDVLIAESADVSKIVLNSLIPYKKMAPFYKETISFVSEALSTVSDRHISTINEATIKLTASYLGIRTQIDVSSKLNLDYSQVKGPGDWAFEISKQIGAEEYINPVGGRELFDKQKFASANIKLQFIKPREMVYQQDGLKFEPWLSIIDVLMFNGREKNISMLNEYEITE